MHPIFDLAKLNIFVVALALVALFAWCFLRAKKGRLPYIRRMAGIDAIEEAVGRATEMGRPVLFIPGIQDMDDVQTMAGLQILGHVAKTAAEYDTRLDVPVSRSLVMATSREIIKEAYTSSGRPDSYRDDIVTYQTNEQFAYVATVSGGIIREKPAACFYVGAFFAESLLLAETGNAIGAIQIAGTAMTHQIPFFIAACDYTLIGEELFAAGAYMSKDPALCAALHGQDLAKLAAVLCIALGSILATAATLTNSAHVHLLASTFSAVFGDQLPSTWFGK